MLYLWAKKLFEISLNYTRGRVPTLTMPWDRTASLKTGKKEVAFKIAEREQRP